MTILSLHHDIEQRRKTAAGNIRLPWKFSSFLNESEGRKERRFNDAETKRWPWVV